MVMSEKKCLVYKRSDGKCWTEKNYQKSEILDENVLLA